MREKFIVSALGDVCNENSEPMTRRQAASCLNKMFKRTITEFNIDPDENCAEIFEKEENYFEIAGETYYQMAVILSENTKTGRAYLIEEILRALDRVDNGMTEYRCNIESTGDRIDGTLYHIRELAKQLAKDPWISCKKALPKKSGYYMVTEYRYDPFDWEYKGNFTVHVEKVRYESRSRKWCRAQHCEIVAWMPVPEPYTEETIADPKE